MLPSLAFGEDIRRINVGVPSNGQPAGIIAFSGYRYAFRDVF